LNINNLKHLKEKVTSDTAKTLISFTSGKLVIVFTGAAGALLYARWIGPDILGEFKQYGILTGYLGFLPSFIAGAYRREYTYYSGKGEHITALYAASVSKWFYIRLTWFGTLIFIVLVIYNLLAQDIRAVAGWAAQIPVYIGSVYGSYLITLYKSNQNFRLLNKADLSSTLLSLLLLPAVYFFSYFGLLLRASIQPLVNTLLKIRYAPHIIQEKFDPKELKRLIKMSIPLEIPAALDKYILLPSLNYLVLITLGKYELGVFAMAVAFQSFLKVFSSSFSQIFTTKSMLNHGKYGSISKAFAYIIKPTIFSTSLGLILTLVSILALTPFVSSFASQYVDSLPIFNIIAFEVVFIMLSLPFPLMASALVHKPRILMRISKVLVTVLVYLLLEKTILNLAWAYLAGIICHTIIGYYFMYTLIRNEQLTK